MKAHLRRAEGDLAGADSILAAWEGVGEQLGGAWPSVVRLAWERAEVAERLGHMQDAMHAYRYVAEAWVDADLHLRSTATEACRRLERLGGRSWACRSSPPRSWWRAWWPRGQLTSR
jgi:hypothetical protein